MSDLQWYPKVICLIKYEFDKDSVPSKKETLIRSSLNVHAQFNSLYYILPNKHSIEKNLKPKKLNVVFYKPDT